MSLCQWHCKWNHKQLAPLPVRLLQARCLRLAGPFHWFEGWGRNHHLRWLGVCFLSSYLLSFCKLSLAKCHTFFAFHAGNLSCLVLWILSKVSFESTSVTTSSIFTRIKKLSIQRIDVSTPWITFNQPFLTFRSFHGPSNISGLLKCKFAAHSEKFLAKIKWQALIA